MSLFGMLRSSGVERHAALPGVDTVTARTWHEGKGCIFVDIREDAEYGVEHIPGAVPVPLSRFEQALPPARGKTKAVFYCLSGKRTQGNASRLAAAGFAEAYILEGGLGAWKAQGAPTAR